MCDASVPVLTFASGLPQALSKCQNHKEHWKNQFSSVADASDVWSRVLVQTGTKRQMRYTSRPLKNMLALPCEA